MAIYITWLGHSAFKLGIDGLSILIDPFLSGNPFAPVSPDEIAADYILITHAHANHLGDSPAIAQRTGATIIAISEICNWLGQNHQIEHVQSQNLGGGRHYPFGHVKFVRADHSSSFEDGSFGGLASGIILTVNDKRLYFAGDTALFSEMSIIGELGIDVAFLPIGDTFTMGPHDSVQAIKLIRPQSAFPTHYDTFEMIQQDVFAWAQRVQNETDALPIVVDPGASFIVD